LRRKSLERVSNSGGGEHDVENDGPVEDVLAQKKQHAELATAASKQAAPEFLRIRSIAWS
jgi:hypothetical protein